MPRSNTTRSPLRRSTVFVMALIPVAKWTGRTRRAAPPVRVRPVRLTSGKSGSRRRHVGRIPLPEIGERRVRQRAVEVGPDPGLVTQILRLAVAPVQPRKGAEQPRVALRRHQGIQRREISGIEGGVGFATRLD